MTTLNVIILGAGLSGPALALGLAKQGIRSTIYERRPAIEDIGGVLMLAPNAVRVLDKVLGIEQQVRPLGYSFSSIGMYVDGGKNLEEVEGIDVYHSRAQGDYKGITITRPALHRKLIHLCMEESLIEIKFSKKMKDIRESEYGVTVRFEDGTFAKGDILFAADGIHSKVRNHVMSRYEDAWSYAQHYTGHVVLGSAMSRSQLPKSTAKMELPAFIYTKSGTILMFPTDPKGNTFQWSVYLPETERDRISWELYRQSRAIKCLQKEWGQIRSEPIRTIIASVDDSDLLLWAPYEIPDLPTWHTDRVCLLGDACHAISPSAGQGAAQAFEDVGLLVRLLNPQAVVQKGFPAVFRHFEKTRKVRLDYIKRFTDRSLAMRYPTSSTLAWWAKKLGHGGLFKLMGKGSYFLEDYKAIGYDITSEDVKVL